MNNTPLESNDAWEPLSEAERNDVWDRFEVAFNFRPSTDPDKWPVMKEPIPSITYSLSAAFRVMTNPRLLEKEINIKTRNALQLCVGEQERLYALDWQHDCYWFYPYRSFELGDPSAWNVPVLPNGDYHIFLAEDFSFGLFGHPWEQTICVFGQVLLDAFDEDPPMLLTKPVRENGQAISDL